MNLIHDMLGTGAEVLSAVLVMVGAIAALFLISAALSIH